MRILIAEDDNDVAGFVTAGLAALGHDTVHVSDGKALVLLASEGGYDAVVLDRMLPGIDGLEALRRLRAAANDIPVIVLTALGGIADRVDGLEAGADDYLVKPFAFVELAARLNALVPRRPSEVTTRIDIGDITLDLLRRETLRGGKIVHLQPREFTLLEQLMRHAGRTVTRTMLLELVWGFHFDPQTNIVESHMSRLRTKLKADGGDDPIETIRGAGYRMRADA